MAVYMCDECNNMIDEDYHGCNEHPKGMCCDDCACNLSCEGCEEMQEDESLLDDNGHCCACAYEQEQKDTNKTLEH